MDGPAAGHAAGEPAGGSTGSLVRAAPSQAGLITVGAVLGAVTVLRRRGAGAVAMLVGPAAAVNIVLAARRAGLSWSELGLGVGSRRRGAAYALRAGVLITVVHAAMAAVPVLRPAFLDERYRQSLPQALLGAGVVVPVGTVLPEEIAFRGALWALVRRDHGEAWATAVTSVLFGLWHVLPSLQLGGANAAVRAVAGRDGRDQLMVVSGVVAFTGLAGAVFCELRRRSGSLLAPAGLHWAANGLAMVFSAALWREAARSG